MLRLVASMAVGCTVGFFGAVPPGPVGLTVVGHASAGDLRRAAKVGLGGASVDFAICTALSLGASPLLAMLTSHAWVRSSLSLLYLGVGLVVLARALRAPPTEEPDRAAAPRAGSYLRGLLGGALNPTLVLNWSAAMATLLAMGLLAPGRAAGCAFAVGVGTGVLGWFTLLARVVAGGRARGQLVRIGTVAAALFLVLTGSIGAARAL